MTLGIADALEENLQYRFDDRDRAGEFGVYFEASSSALKGGAGVGDDMILDIGEPAYIGSHFVIFAGDTTQ